MKTDEGERERERDENGLWYLQDITEEGGGGRRSDDGDPRLRGKDRRHL